DKKMLKKVIDSGDWLLYQKV
ncbi:gamma-glutamylcyclotransferase, partial [Bacillus toyonensis]